MPPKQQEKTKKVAEDKTFGMKNKKGSKGQKAVALAQQQAAQAGRNKEAIAKEKAKADMNKKKADEAKRKEELEALFQPVMVAQKVPFGVDPKSVLCINFKNGACDRGAKCKFSHDLDVNRKAEKKDIYTDSRANDTMDKWDDAKLREVVLSKSGNAVTTTDIVCKHFIEAIERGSFGWFWECPNGQDCKYKHALPPGFVLKSQKKKDEESAAAQVISLEDYIENERHKLPAKLTPVTAETFATWKKTRMDKKQAEADAMRKAKETQAAAGKAAGMSGRDLFSYNPLLYEDEDDGGDDDDEWDLAQYRKRTEREREESERMRIEALGGTVDSLNLNGHETIDEEGEDEEESAEEGEEQPPEA